MNETTTRTATYEVPAHKMDALKKVVGRVDRRATKIGVDGFTVRTVGERAARVYRITSTGDAVVTYNYVPVDDEQPIVGTTYNFGADITTGDVGATTLYTVEVAGTEPFVGGHTFVASIDHADGEPNVVSTVPGADVPEGLVAAWVGAGADCVHCGLNRRRNRTFLLMNGDGDIAQVGSTCIKDYFPGTAAEDIARLAELWITLDLEARSGDDYEGGYGAGAGGWIREDVLAQACASIRLHGWTSKAMAEGGGRIATATRVLDAFTWRPTRDEPVRPDPVTDEDVEKADAVVAWVEALDPRLTDDYLWNLKSATARKVTSPRHLGLVVSAVGSHDRDVAKAIERAAEVTVPAVAGRHEMTGKVLSLTEKPGFNYNTLVWKMTVLVETAGGGTYRVWGSVPTDFEPDNNIHVGDTMKFTATVTKSDSDASFGFFKRPAKCTNLTMKEAKEA